MVDDTPRKPLPSLPGLPATREQQQQARRLAEAGMRELERVKQAVEPCRQQAVTKSTSKGSTKVGNRVGRGLFRPRV